MSHCGYILLSRMYAHASLLPTSLRRARTRATPRAAATTFLDQHPASAPCHWYALFGLRGEAGLWFLLRGSKTPHCPKNMLTDLPLPSAYGSAGRRKNHFYHNAPVRRDKQAEKEKRRQDIPCLRLLPALRWKDGLVGALLIYCSEKWKRRQKTNTLFFRRP